MIEKDWLEIEIGDVAHLYQPKTISSKMLVENGEFPVYGANGIIGQYDKFNHEDPQLLITCRGATCGNVHITLPFSWINGNAMVVQPFDNSLLQLEYLKFVFSNKNRTQKAISGSAQPQITRTGLAPIKFPLPPLPIQRAIVAKIETLFTSLDKSIADLTKAQKQLVVYRQAVLKKAFEGELTKEWRTKQTDLPSAEELLEQIKEERQKHNEQKLADWEQTVKVWEKNGKEGKKPRKPGKPTPFQLQEEENLKELPILPECWSWTIYENICLKIRNGISKKPNEDPAGDKIFRISSVRPAKFDLTDFRLISNNGELDEFLLKKGDLVFTRYNGTRKFVGVCAMFNSDERFLYPDKLIQTRVLDTIFNPSFIEYASNCSASRKFVEFKIRTTAGQSGISGGDIKAMPIPICSMTEQQQIVREIESRLSVCDNVEKCIAESLLKAKALRQSILKKAFESKLLTNAEIAKCKQAPDYEPASVLLERIKEEKEKL